MGVDDDDCGLQAVSPSRAHCARFPFLDYNDATALLNTVLELGLPIPGPMYTELAPSSLTAPVRLAAGGRFAVSNTNAYNIFYMRRSDELKVQ